MIQLNCRKRDKTPSRLVNPILWTPWLRNSTSQTNQFLISSDTEHTFVFCFQKISSHKSSNIFCVQQQTFYGKIQSIRKVACIMIIHCLPQKHATKQNAPSNKWAESTAQLTKFEHDGWMRKCVPVGWLTSPPPKIAWRMWWTVVKSAV